MTGPSIVRTTCLVLWLLVAGSAAIHGQFGHPLKGQWSGELTIGTERTRLLLDLQWDGTAVTGTINPGPDASVVRSVTFDYGKVSTWGVTMTAEGRDTAGRAVAISISGTLENLGAARRLLHGTWVQGARSGAFSLTRN